MHTVVKKALRMAAVCAAAATVAVGTAVPAWAQGAKTLSLPIELNDFNADNVLFEYDLLGHGGLASLGTGSETDLVETTLGANGKPVYTRKAVEGEARAMLEELNSSWEATAPEGGAAKLYAALQKNLGSKVGETLLTDNGDDSNPSKVTFEGENAWSIASEGTYIPAGHDLYKDATPAWKQDGDGVLGYDPATPLARTYKASDLLGEGATSFAGKNIGFYTWISDQNAAGAKVTLACGGASASKVFGAEGDTAMQLAVPAGATGAIEVTVTIAPAEGASAKKACRVAVVALTASDASLVADNGGANDLGSWAVKAQLGNQDENNRFYNNDWRAFDAKGNELKYEGLYASAGSIAWQQSDDGVIALEAGSSIVRTFDIDEDAVYQPRLWAAAPGMKVEFYAGDTTDGTPLTTIDTTGKGGWVDGDYISVPKGTKKLTVKLTSLTEGAKITALKVVSIGSASKLGDYDETVAKYADGSKTLSDATSCMDYVYCMLNHLYDETSLSYDGETVKTPVKNYYSSITLNKNPESEDGADTGYSFVADYLHSSKESSTITGKSDVPEDGFKDLVYDLKAGTIANTEAGKGQDRAGFFPLDDLNGGQQFKARFDFENDSEAQAAKVAAMGKHNYHYSMVSHSSFTYDSSKNQFFTFEGDDDTYLFINNKLVIDLGGAHEAHKATVSLEDESPEAGKTWAQYLGLEDGNSYNFDFFYTERHTDFSDFAVSTNIVLSRRSLTTDSTLETEPAGDAFNAGDEALVSAVITNNGTDTIHDISIADIPGAEIDWEKSGLEEGETFDLKSGENKTIYFKYKVTAEDSKKGEFTLNVVAKGKDGRGNDVEAPASQVTAKVVKPATPATPDNSNGNASGSDKTTKVSETSKTVKTSKGGLAQTGDRTVAVAIAVALAGAVVCAVGMIVRRRHE